MAANSLDLLSDLIAHARGAGADAADAVLVSGTSLSVQRRLGKTEHVERSEGQDLGLRVFLGQHVAIVSSSSVAPSSFRALAERAVAMARVVPEDPYAGLADTAVLPEPVALDLEDASEPATEALVARAAAAEEAAFAVAGITNSEGADAGFGRTEVFLVTSAGSPAVWSAPATRSRGFGDRRRRHRDAARLRLSFHRSPRRPGRAHGDRAQRRGARDCQAQSGTAEHREVAGGLRPTHRRWLVGHLAGAINGASVARGTSFLKDRLGQRIFAAGIAIRDDPRRVRGLRSRQFDGEGTPTAARALIDDGVLTTWLLDSRSARQLGLRSTGHAARGTGGPPSPSPTNLYLAAGSLTPAELMADIKLGLYVTELIGMGVNGVTGDYSRGAAGFMIRDGAIAEPVAEITIASNLLDMFSHLTPANDLRFRRGTDSPTVRVEGMTMAGG